MVSNLKKKNQNVVVHTNITVNGTGIPTQHRDVGGGSRGNVISVTGGGNGRAGGEYWPPPYAPPQAVTNTPLKISKSFSHAPRESYVTENSTIPMDSSSDINEMSTPMNMSTPSLSFTTSNERPKISSAPTHIPQQKMSMSTAPLMKMDWNRSTESDTPRMEGNRVRPSSSSIMRDPIPMDVDPSLSAVTTLSREKERNDQNGDDMDVLDLYPKFTMVDSVLKKEVEDVPEDSAIVPYVEQNETMSDTRVRDVEDNPRVKRPAVERTYTHPGREIIPFKHDYQPIRSVLPVELLTTAPEDVSEGTIIRNNIMEERRQKAELMKQMEEEKNDALILALKEAEDEYAKRIAQEEAELEQMQEEYQRRRQIEDLDDEMEMEKEITERVSKKEMKLRKAKEELRKLEKLEMKRNKEAKYDFIRDESDKSLKNIKKAKSKVKKMEKKMKNKSKKYNVNRIPALGHEIVAI